MRRAEPGSDAWAHRESTPITTTQSPTSMSPVPPNVVRTTQKRLLKGAARGGAGRAMGLAMAPKLLWLLRGALMAQGGHMMGAAGSRASVCVHVGLRM